MIRTIASLGALLAFFGLAKAGSINNIVAFGDSLSDDGNALAVYLSDPGGYPHGAPIPLPTSQGGSNYTVGRFTDGPDTNPASAFPGKVWVEDLAGKLGVSAPTASLTGGTDYAVGSAQTGVSNPQDMGNQVGAFLGKVGVAPSTSLYTFWGGANDIFAGGPAKTAADNIFGEISAIANSNKSGGLDFLWLNLPAASGLTNAEATAFNSEMSLDMATLQALFPTDHFTGVDIYTFYQDGAGGLGNCVGMLSPNPDVCATWDGLHPTNVAHQDIADVAYASLVPEPALWWVAGLAVTGLIVTRSRKAVA